MQIKGIKEPFYFAQYSLASLLPDEKQCFSTQLEKEGYIILLKIFESRIVGKKLSAYQRQIAVCRRLNCDCRGGQATQAQPVSMVIRSPGVFSFITSFLIYLFMGEARVKARGQLAEVASFLSLWGF